MKTKQADARVMAAGKLALALACTLIAGQAAAVPYASLIRFGEPSLVGSNINVDLNYTLNEDADSVTVELYNNTTDSVVRTYVFNSPDAETTRGRHTIVWDGNDDATNPVVVGGNEFIIRVNVQKFETTNEWTLITNNASPFNVNPNFQQKTLFNGYSPNDLWTSKDAASNQFGVLFAMGYGGSVALGSGGILLGMDLAPLYGDGSTPIVGKNPAPSSLSFATWKVAQDPIDPNLIWWGGQAGTSPGPRIGHFNTNSLDPADIQEFSDVSWTTSDFPRTVAVTTDSGSGDRVVYWGGGNNGIFRLTTDAAFPYLTTASELITSGNLDGSASNYVQDLKFDAAGNIYLLTRNQTADLAGEGRLFRWNQTDLEAAPGVPLTEANAAWIVRVPATTSLLTALHIDDNTGNVYVSATAGTPRGVFIAGNTADATLASTPYTLTVGDQILDFDNPVQFPAGYTASSSTGGKGQGLFTDLYGNLYLAHRPNEEIYSFSPPNDDVQHDITTLSPDTLSDDLLLITLEDFSAVSAGPGAPVTVRWTTGSEIDNTGFNLERVDLGGGNATTRVNTFLIPAAGENGGGADYVVTDSPVADGENRGYILIDIDSNGNQKTHGPIPVRVGTSAPSAVPVWSLY
jgi:hypothetical protein